MIQCNHEVLAELPIEEIMPHLCSGHQAIAGYVVNTSTRTLKVFKYKGCKCARCRKVANIARVERELSSGRLCLKLYRKLPNGHLDFFNKDHIRPRSRGGSNHLSNLQPMCFECNKIKGAKYDNTNHI